MKRLEGTKCHCGCTFAFDQGGNKPPKCCECESEFKMWFAKGHEPKSREELISDKNKKRP
jgi:hypothetical protein